MVDLACGTGSVALAASAAGARVTGVDITPELIALGAQKAEAAGATINWVTGDASDTGLPGGSFDAVMSNMGIIFVEPTSQVAEIARLLRPGGVLGFSSWVPDPDTPFYKPIVTVLGPPPASGYSPDQWGMTETITDRLAADFDDIEYRNRHVHMATGVRRRGDVPVGARVADSRVAARRPGRGEARRAAGRL